MKLRIRGEANLAAEVEHPMLADAEPSAADGYHRAVGQRAVPYAAADTIAGFENDYVATRFSEQLRGGQSGEAGTNHTNVTAFVVFVSWAAHAGTITTTSRD